MTSETVLRFKIELVIEPDGDGFHVYAPALKGMHVGGDTEEEALQNAEDAALAYLRSLIKHGDPIPLAAVQEIAALNGNSESHEGVHGHPHELALALT